MRIDNLVIFYLGIVVAVLFSEWYLKLYKVFNGPTHVQGVPEMYREIYEDIPYI